MSREPSTPFELRTSLRMKASEERRPMITIIDDEKTFAIKAIGHAGFAEKGKDIICSAVSVLLYAYAFELIDLKHNPIINDVDTFVEVIPTRLEENERDVEIVFNTVVQGLHLVTGGYEDYVKLEINKWRE